jgi:hypothetical protein
MIWDRHGTVCRGGGQERENLRERDHLEFSEENRKLLLLLLLLTASGYVPGGRNITLVNNFHFFFLTT